jgi:hypothetical protein
MATAAKPMEAKAPPTPTKGGTTQAPAQTTATAAAPASTDEQDTISQYDYATLIGELHSKSNVIRFLSSKGYTRAKIAEFMGIRYQHVRNVLLMPVSKPRE